MNVAVREDLRQQPRSDPENLDPERAGGNRKAAIVCCLEQLLLYAIAPDQRRREMHRIQRPERCRRGYQQLS